jgi:hypothetical protein
MSYCVNCGVELDPTLKACPLCTCPVINLMKKDEVTPSQAAPVEYIDNMAERRFSSLIITILLLFVSAICLAIDLSYHDSLRWSRYVIASMGLLWLLLVPPLFMRRMGALSAIAVDFTAIALFLYLIESWVAPGIWFLHLAFPIVGVVFCLTMAGAGLIKAHIVKGLNKLSLILLEAGVLVFCIEPVLGAYTTGKAHVEWSLFVLISCAAMSLLLFVIERKRRLKEILEKNFHI